MAVLSGKFAICCTTGSAVRVNTRVHPSGRGSSIFTTWPPLQLAVPKYVSTPGVLGIVGFTMGPVPICS